MLISDLKLQEKHQRVTSQHFDTQHARKSLHSLEKDALYFSYDSDNPKPFPSAPVNRRTEGWFTEKDIENARLLNDNVGFRGERTANYNRDKYQPKPSQHRYSHIGHPLAKNMEFNGKIPTPPCQPSNTEPRYSKTGVVDPQASRAAVCQDRQGLLDQSGGIQIPKNIQHQFGSIECDNLLSDKAKVESIMNERRSNPRISVHEIPSQARIPRPEMARNPTDPWMYSDLGHWGRSNIFPNAPRTSVSEVRDNYTWDVYTNRIPPTDKFRRNKDAYCKY